jgi:dipeptidase E
MTGALFLGGGGSGADERLLWLEMLTATVRRIVYWPFAQAAERHPEAEAWLQDAVANIAADTDVETWSTLCERDPAELASFDLLFVGGGNTFRLLQHVREHSFLQPVRDFVHGGGSYYGGSAGAVLACDSVDIAIGHNPNEVGVTDFAALGLLAGVAVLPHYDRSQEASARVYAHQHACVVLGIPERSGLVVREGVMTVAGPEPAWYIDESSALEREPGSTWPV